MDDETAIPFGSGAMRAAEIPDPHRDCPPLDRVRRPRLELRCFHKSKGPRVVGLVYGEHLVHRDGCTAYPRPAHEEVELFCDKCGRAWQVEMSLLREVVEVRRLGKVGVAEVSRKALFLGRP